MRTNPPDRKNLLKEQLKPRPSPGQLERRRESLVIVDDESGEEYEIQYPFGERPSDEQIARIIAAGLPSLRQAREKEDDAAFARAESNPVFDNPPSEPLPFPRLEPQPGRESLGLSYPGLEILGRIGSAPKNFVQGFTASGLRNFNELDPAKASPHLWPNVGQAFREVLGYQGIRPRFTAGLDAAASGQGAARIGEVSPEFAPGTLKGAAYDLGVSAGSDILPFTPLARLFSGPGKAFPEGTQAAQPVSRAAPSPSPGQVALRNVARSEYEPGAVAVPAPIVDPPFVQGTGGIYARRTPEPTMEQLGLPPDFSATPDLAPVPPLGAPPGAGGLLTRETPEPSRLGIAAARTGGIVREVLGVPTALRASVDYSGVLRQGAILGARRPVTVARAMGDMVRGGLSEDVFQGQQKAILSRPNAPLYDRHGLFISDTANPAKAEEWFANARLSERIPVLGRLVKGSNRAMSSFLNRLRADTFDKTAQSWQRLGLSPEAHPQEYDALARWLNIATGRGDLGALEKLAPTLQTVFYGPRWQASRLQVMNPLTYVNMPPRARVEAIRDVAAFSSAALSLLTAAKLGGAKVTLDPRNTDFGNIIIGDTRIDVLSGFRPWVKFFTAMATDEHITTGGNKRDVDRLTAPFQEARKKLSPVAAYLVDAWAGGDITGADFDPQERAVQLAIPMWIEDAREAMRQEGLLTGGLVSVPGLFGAGLATYENKEGKAAPLHQEDKRNRPTRLPHRYMEGPDGWIVDDPLYVSPASQPRALDAPVDAATARARARKLLLDDEKRDWREKSENPRTMKDNSTRTLQTNPIKAKPAIGGAKASPRNAAVRARVRERMRARK